MNTTYSSYFVTGTDTEVGKTLVASALILKLQAKGHRTVGYKPVVAGMNQVNGEWLNDDLESLLSVSRNVAPTLTANDICPYHLKDPAAPHLVAEKYGIKLELEEMVKNHQLLQDKYGSVIVEGVGGFMVPINSNTTMADFAKEIKLPVILVVSIKLGCISHALLTVEAIKAKGLIIAGWVANCVEPDNEYTKGNISSLKERIQAPLIGIIPRLNIQEYSQSLLKNVYKLISIQKSPLHK